MRRVYWNLWRKTVGERNKSRFKKGAHIRDSIERVETSEWQPADKGILCYFTWYYYHYKQYEWIESLVENRDATCCLRAFRCKCVMLNKHVSPCFCFVFLFFPFPLCFLLLLLLSAFSLKYYFQKGLLVGPEVRDTQSPSSQTVYVHLFTQYLLYLCFAARHVGEGGEC